MIWCNLVAKWKKEVSEFFRKLGCHQKVIFPSEMIIYIAIKNFSKMHSSFFTTLLLNSYSSYQFLMYLTLFMKDG